MSTNRKEMRDQALKWVEGQAGTFLAEFRQPALGIVDHVLLGQDAALAQQRGELNGQRVEVHGGHGRDASVRRAVKGGEVQLIDVAMDDDVVDAVGRPAAEAHALAEHGRPEEGHGRAVDGRRPPQDGQRCRPTVVQRHLPVTHVDQSRVQAVAAAAHRERCDVARRVDVLAVRPHELHHVERHR